MKKLLIAFLMILTIAPAMAINVNGTVIDSEDKKPIISAGVCISETQSCTYTNTDGNFTIFVDTEERQNPTITISSIGYEEEKLPVKENLGNISLKRANAQLEETTKVDINKCEQPDTLADLHASKADFKETGQKVSGTNTPARICIPTECESDEYILIKPNTVDAKCIENQTGKPCNGGALRKITGDQNAETGTVSEVDLNSGEPISCDINTCKSGYHKDLTGESCIADCKCGERQNPTTGECEKSTDTDCTGDITGATAATLVCEGEKSVCRATKCDTANGYELANGECKCTARGFESKNGTCTPKMVLSADDYQNEIADLSANAQKMRENETSLANRAIGAAGIGLTGGGGALLGAALSERAADDEAERAMRAYLETFTCDYGAGKNIKGGEVNVELPGGNDMIDLYTQYARLANDLKIRKEALGIRPGIESEVVIDKASTGLYDDVGTGITGGPYASIARAILDPEGEDAKMWAAMREKTNTTLTAGAITAGVGAVGSLAANIAVNHDKGDKSRQIRDEYAPLYHLYTVVSNIPQPTPNCPSEAPGPWPECICTNSALQFNPNTFKCEPCSGGQVVDTQTHICKCPSDKPWLDPKGTCSAAPQKCQEACGNSPLVAWDSNCNCSCKNGHLYDGQNKTCTCPKNDGYTIDNGVCTRITQYSSTTDIADITLPAGALFDIGKSELRTEAKKALTQFITDANNMQNISECKMEIHGYTDPIGTDASNDKLSTDRANSVRDFLVSNKIGISTSNISTKGHGESDCFCDNSNKTETQDVSCTNDQHLTGNTRYSPCRRVEVKMTCKQTTTSTELQQIAEKTKNAINELTK